MVQKLTHDGMAVVWSTAYLDEAERCSRVALVHEGALLALDRPGALRDTLPGTLFEVIVGDHRRAPEILKQIPGVTDVQMFGERAHVLMDRADGKAADLLASRLADAAVEVTSVRPLAASLEDVFIARLHQLNGATS